MKQKVTFSLSDTAISRGKKYAAISGRSLSSIVETFLMLLEHDDSETGQKAYPSERLLSLMGIGTGDTTETDYKEHLIRRYGN